MSKVLDKRPAYRAKDQFPVRYGFEYNQNAINYRTQIPPLPEKPKHKPDEKAKQKKLNDIEEKIKKVKEARQEKKEAINKLNKEYDHEIDEYKKKVELGKRCILVLEYDIEVINDEIYRKTGKINRLQTKVNDLIGQIRETKNRNKPAKRSNKNYEEMTNWQLDEERRRIEHIMSTKIISKKEESQLNNLLTKISRAKLEPNRPSSEPDQPDSKDGKFEELEEDLARIKDKENKIKAERFDLYKERQQIEFKIEDIKEDIATFFDKMKQIAQVVDENTQTKQLSEESKALKENIYKLREELGKINSDYDEKIKQYETEQEKIKWIGWATKVQEKKREQWEQEKAERKKQRLREKNPDGKTTEGQNKQPEQGEKDEKIERKRPNRNQKEIDTCAFLVDYCKRLYPTTEENQKRKEKKDVNIKDELKKGQWAKEKGVEVIQSKKSKLDEEDDTPKTKYNKKKQQAQKEEQIVDSNRLSHDYFVAQSFDSVKIIPPQNVEELDKIIKDLEDKIEYYLSHPEDNIQQKFAKDKQYVQKAGYKESANIKNTKSRGNKGFINSEDFPSL